VLEWTAMDYMSVALALARLATGLTSPNPAVGAVIVKDGVVLGQGYTQPPGSDHAEIVALKQAGAEARGATLYVTLEPCCHFGRTPPCTQAIIQAGIREVHFSIIDPNPLVSGKGQAELEQAGIAVYCGARAAEATEINEAFIKFVTSGLPFLTVKFAASLDGRIATRTGDSKWISGEPARRQVQRLRFAADAIMTGANTIIADDPQLTVRLFDKGGTSHKQPLRVIVDGQGRTPPAARVFAQPGQTVIATDTRLSSPKKQRLLKSGAELLELPAENGVFDLRALLGTLAERQITSVLVEAGGILVGALFDLNLVDKVVAFFSPLIIGGEQARPAVAGRGFEKLNDCTRLKFSRVEMIGDDIMAVGYVRK
jgi:diaminohydroxyphosphoribosylaminopyrimidine deaminase / 5-amino-6-(5-phosphoribosylamino)uracil reductase